MTIVMTMDIIPLSGGCVKMILRLYPRNLTTKDTKSTKEDKI